MLYTDSRLRPVYPHQQYVAPDGTQYPPNYPKDEIPALSLVTEAAQPEDESLVVTGFIINEEKQQVWQTRPKTDKELSADADLKRRRALSQKWPDPFDLLDDILDRGTSAVKSERDAIKAANPKGAALDDSAGDKLPS